MKIAISANGKSLDSQLDQRFGRAECMILLETDTMEFEARDNGAASSSGGAGIAAAQSIVDKGAQAVITGSVGPNAMGVLSAAKLAIYKGSAASVRQNVELFKAGELERIDVSGPAHFGLRPSGSGK